MRKNIHLHVAYYRSPPLASLVRRKRLSAHGSPTLACLVRRKRLSAHGSPRWPASCAGSASPLTGVPRWLASCAGSAFPLTGDPRWLASRAGSASPFTGAPRWLASCAGSALRPRESPAGLPGIIIGRLLDLTLVLLLTAFRKETLQFPDFANLFRGGRFSYASRLEAIFDLFAIDLHSGRPSKAPHI